MTIRPLQLYAGSSTQLHSDGSSAGQVTETLPRAGVLRGMAEVTDTFTPAAQDITLRVQGPK